MKINLEIDCTPEEARRAMGLPDLSPVHERYVQLMVQAVEQQGTPEAVDAMVRSWAPMGEAGMTFWRTLFEGGNKTGS